MSKREIVQPGNLEVTGVEAPPETKDIFGYYRKVRNASQDMLMQSFDYRLVQDVENVVPTLKLKLEAVLTDMQVPANLEGILQDVLEHAITYYQSDKTVDLKAKHERAAQRINLVGDDNETP